MRRQHVAQWSWAAVAVLWTAAPVASADTLLERHRAPFLLQWVAAAALITVCLAGLLRSAAAPMGSSATRDQAVASAGLFLTPLLAVQVVIDVGSGAMWLRLAGFIVMLVAGLFLFNNAHKQPLSWGAGQPATSESSKSQSARNRPTE